jgi:acyl carrier protein
VSERETKIKQIVAKKLNVSEDKVVSKAFFVDNLGADSQDLFELIMAFEDEFKIKISGEDAAKLQTVQDATAYLADKIQ